MSKTTGPRPPRVFSPDDPDLILSEPASDTVDADAPVATPSPPAGDRSRRSRGPAVSASTNAAGGLATAAATAKRGIRWGAMLFSALTGLATLAAGVWFTRFVSVAVARDDWVGWTATALLCLALFALAAILIREIVGLSRLGRLHAIRRDAEKALAARDAKAERATLASLRPLYAGRPDCRWALQRLDEHMQDVRDPGDLLALAERDLLVPLDVDARRIVMTSAKRVAVVTAMSPMMFIAVIFVLVENVRMLGRVAALYGGRPGMAGALRLGRMVIAHLLASGGVALTEDLVGQFIGQDMLRRLSRRLGEGAFNGALTARIGASAIGIIRPLPFIEATPVRVRDLVAELLRRTQPPAGQAKDTTKDAV
ncbi:MAG: TIGR01620 family protein [Hyphomicrobium sp.]